MILLLDMWLMILLIICRIMLLALLLLNIASIAVFYHLFECRMHSICDMWMHSNAFGIEQGLLFVSG